MKLWEEVEEIIITQRGLGWVTTRFYVVFEHQATSGIPLRRVVPGPAFTMATPKLKP